ncbi:MAG: transporter substrate-binding domain-containing protein, partial [Clostridia bacterium]|nr:transporter substrate-binding domain-containing protein [Clostridia bacterium]
KYREEHGALGIKARIMRSAKIVAAFFVCLLLVISNFIFSDFKNAFADDTQSNNRTVIAGVFNFDGYHMKDEKTGALTGYGIEFLNLVSQYSHLNFEYTAYDKTWDDMLDMLEKGEIQVATSASWTQERAEKFDYSLSIGRKNTILSVRADEDRFDSDDYTTYNGMKVGLIANNTANDVLREFARKKGFTFQEVYSEELSDSKELKDS